MEGRGETEVVKEQE